MKILYIRKQERGPFWKRNLRLLRDSYYWHNRVGFFCASLRTQADVTRVMLSTAEKYTTKQFNRFDAIIFNYECNFLKKGQPLDTCIEAVRSLKPKLGNVPTILLVTSDHSKLLPSNEDMELFDLVFRRERYKDLDRYDLNSVNKEKIKTTVLSCPLVPATILNYEKIKAEDYGYDEVPGAFEHDVFFLGQETSKDRKRTRILQAIRNSHISFFGGLHEDVRDLSKDIPLELRAPRMSRDEFYDTTRKSKINLALHGYGQFTYRHWECWALCSFMISNPAINEVQLPFEAVDGLHFVTFEDTDDLISKIRYYLDYPEERSAIAKNGRDLFTSEYDFHKHGKYIANEIQNVLS
jgi:spore maturation protein CgeB